MQTSKDEMIGVLIAMSIVSKRLAKQLRDLEKGEGDEKRVYSDSEKSKESCR